MTYKIRIVPEAKLEIKKAKEWYRNQSIELGDKFAAEIKRAIRSLASSQVDHKPVFITHRRMLLKRFPYTVYYNRHERFFSKGDSYSSP